MLHFTPSPQTSRYAFEKHDKVTINDIEYFPIDVTDNGYVFCRVDGKGVAESFSHDQLSLLVENGKLRYERGAFLSESAKKSLKINEMISNLSAAQHIRARGREAVISSFLELEMESKVQRTDESIKRNLDAITGRAARKLEKNSQYINDDTPHSDLKVPKFSPRTLRRWLKAFEEYTLAGLFDSKGLRGRRGSQLCPKSHQLLEEGVRGYLTEERKTQAAIYEDVKVLFNKENHMRRKMLEERELAEEKAPPELTPLKAPSKETVRRAILALDPFACDVARRGLEYAKSKYAPVGVGLGLIRPLQRVEMDTWRVDLIQILNAMGLSKILSDDDRKRLGLTGKEKRLWLTVAMCATTRCILAMRLSRSPSASATIEALDMAMQDKGVWADAAGALSPWKMFGHIPYLYTDSGKEYTSYDVRVAANDMGICLQHAPAGLAEMRGTIERFFRTMSTGLMQRLTGRTFSNVLQRGDYDSKARAALTVDELCTVLVRWVVDAYHRKPHRGLGGETPFACWERLTSQYGVGPRPDLSRRRLAFGTRSTATVQEDGITVLGVRYHSDALVDLLLRRKDRQVEIRWYKDDLGAIAVNIGRDWVEVPSVLRRFDGVKAQVYLEARRSLELRFKHEAQLQEEILFDAIDEISSVNAEAMNRVGLLVENWTKKRLQAEEEKLKIGFKIEPTADLNASLEKTQAAFGTILSTVGLSGGADKGADAKQDAEFSAEMEQVENSDVDKGRKPNNPSFNIEDE